MDTTDPAAYIHASRTDVPIELEALSYHHCPYVRAQVARKTNRVHVQWHLAEDKEPIVVFNLLENSNCDPLIVEVVAVWMVHSSEMWSSIWRTLTRTRGVPAYLHNFLVEREKARIEKIRVEQKLPAPVCPPQVFPPLSKGTEHRLMRFMLRIEHARPNAVITQYGAWRYSTSKRKMVREQFKKLQTYLAQKKRKSKKRRNKPLIS